MTTNTTKDLLRSAAAIYIDTSSLMHNTNLINFLQDHYEEGMKIIIPSCVHTQLMKLGGENSPRGAQAREALEICEDLYKTCFQIEATEEKKPARFFIGCAEAKIYGAPILVITQSADLAHSLNLRRTRGCKVLMKRVTIGGQLANFDLYKLPSKFTKLSDRTNASDVLKALM